MSVSARLLIVIALWMGPVASAGGPTESVDLGAQVVKVTGEGKAQRATLDKGKRAGLKIGDVGELYPMRTSEGSTGLSVDFNVRVALGRVVEVKDDAATVALDAVADKVEAGAYYAYKVTVPSELAQSALFRVTALGIGLRPQYDEHPFVTVEAMLADPSAARRDKALDAMIADVKAMKSVVEDTLKSRIEEGQHHGQSAGQVVDLLDRAQLADFLGFVEGFPGKYIGHVWKFPEVYFTWVINGTPSGEKYRKLRAMKPTIAAAEAATTAGKLDEARAQWQTVLRNVPDHKDATEAVTRIDRILMLTRQTTDDPDDTAGGYQLMDQLFDLGAYELAMKQNDGLRKRNYEPFKVMRMRGFLLVRLQKWKEADEVFKKLMKQKPDDTSLANWSRYALAKGRIAKAPSAPNAHAELAAVHVDTKSWDAALSEYRKVLESDKSTAKQRDAAKLAQERISLQKDIDARLDWAKSDLAKHDVTKSRERITQIARLADKLGDPKQVGKILDELAQLARSSSEEELALELFKKRVESVPDSQDAQTALAYALLNFDRIDEAEAAAKKGADIKGDPAYAYLILSYVARARDDLATAEKFALKAASNSPKYPWPMLTLARAEAARDHWQAALDHARKALELDGESFDMRSTHAAVSRGLQAYEALQADPKATRERLRMVRALAELGLAKRVGDEIAKLPADGSWRSDGWWSLAVSPDSRVLLRDRLAAARAAKPTTETRKRALAMLEARTALRANPKDDATRIALARLYIKTDDFDTGLATLAPLMTQQPVKPAVGDLVRDAREALDIAQQLQLARAAIGRSDYDGAIRMALAAQKIHDRIGTQYGRITVREIRSDALAERGKYPEAIAVIEEARALGAADGDPLLAVLADQRLGRLRAAVGTNEALHKALEDSRKLAEDSDDEVQLYYALQQLSQLEADEGHSAQALEYARRAWTLAERTGRRDFARSARFQLADASLDANRMTDAEQLATKLLVDSRTAEDVDNEQRSLMVLGFVAMMRGQGKIARARFQEVYDLGTRTGDTNWRAVARRFEGSAWLTADHDPVKAAAALAQADALYESLGEGWGTSQRSGVLRDLADARLQAGKLADARKAADQALAIAQRFQRTPALASAQWMLALIAVKEGKGDDALKRAQEAVDGAQKTDDTALLWNAWHALARARELEGQAKPALEAYEKALDYLGRALQATGGETERQGYMSTGRVREVYKDAVQLLLEQGQTDRAMEILEVSRDAMLKQLFDPTKIKTTDPKLRASLDKYAKTRSRVQGLEKQLESAMDKSAAQRSAAQIKALSEDIAKTRQELNQVVLDLKVTHRQLFQALAVNPQNLVGRRNDLPKGSVLVEYFVAEDALYAFVIAASLTQPAVVRVNVTSAQLEEAITDYRDALIDDSEKDHKDKKIVDKIDTLGRQLEDWLLEPLRTHIANASTVILLPFGQLYYVPFDALVVSEPNQPVRYAIEDYRISVQTATTLEHLLGPPRARPTGTMLAVSNPDGTLPGAQREVQRIVKTAVPDAQVLGQNQATIKKFSDVAGTYRYLHLATHGILDADPRKSYLKLSDGPLTVEQISQLQGLDSANEMVVLSACETAMEKGNSTGDELVSLAVAFAMAGSPSLVASLWDVSDDSTAELMETFYRALEQHQGDRLDALRKAKLNLLRLEKGKDHPFASPWHWSSFQLYGDFRASVPAS